MPENPDAHLLGPLAQLYSRAGLPLPSLEVMPGESVPEPYRTLLVHGRDMTRTLEGHHRIPIHLRVLSSHVDASRYLRTVALELDGSNQVVEFGATQAFLERIPEPWRAQILEGKKPFGGILTASGIPYRSRPSAFFRTRGDAFIRSALGIPGEPPLYGRRNTLSNALDQPLAEIIEILPP